METPGEVQLLRLSGHTDGAHPACEQDAGRLLVNCALGGAIRRQWRGSAGIGHSAALARTAAQAGEQVTAPNGDWE